VAACCRASGHSASCVCWIGHTGHHHRAGQERHPPIPTRPCAAIEGLAWVCAFGSCANPPPAPDGSSLRTMKTGAWLPATRCQTMDTSSTAVEFVNDAVHCPPPREPHVFEDKSAPSAFHPQATTRLLLFRRVYARHLEPRQKQNPRDPSRALRARMCSSATAAQSVMAVLGHRRSPHSHSAAPVGSRQRTKARPARFRGPANLTRTRHNQQTLICLHGKHPVIELTPLGEGQARRGSGQMRRCISPRPAVVGGRLARTAMRTSRHAPRTARPPRDPADASVKRSRTGDNVPRMSGVPSVLPITAFRQRIVQVRFAAHGTARPEAMCGDRCVRRKHGERSQVRYPMSRAHSARARGVEGRIGSLTWAR